MEWPSPQSNTHLRPVEASLQICWDNQVISLAW